MRPSKLLPTLALLALCLGIGAQSTAETRLKRDHGALFSQRAHGPAAAFSFFRFPAGRSLDLVGADAHRKADRFWTDYGEAFGIEAGRPPTLLRTFPDRYGGLHLVYQQSLGDWPVFGAELTLHFDRDLQLRSGGGFFVLPRAESPSSAARPDDAPPFDRRQVLSQYFAAQEPTGEWDIPTAGEPFLLEETLLGGRGIRRYRTDRFLVEEIDGARAYQVFLDRATGRVVRQIRLHCDLLNREVYEKRVQANNLLWQESDVTTDGLSPEAATLVTATGETYALFARTFGRNSYDDAGGKMISVLDANVFPASQCPNAQAGTSLTYYCLDAVADDVVAHEWAHVYTNRLSDLIYQWESGAINEAFSDIIGEVVDLLNTSGNDTGDDQVRFDCDDTGLRWKIAEDATGFSAPIRDMFSPSCNDDPAGVDEFYCAADLTDDDGGVHINSGVLNRFFTLLVDGGNRNGFEVPAIGMTKATHLIYHAFSAYVSTLTDYSALAPILEAAAVDLIGRDLLALTVLDLPAMSSGQVFGAADLAAVQAALSAVAMAATSTCDELPLLDPNTPDLCTDASVVTVFSEDWESGFGSWTTSQNPNAAFSWQDKPWAENAQLPDGRGGKAAFAPNPDVGNCISDNEAGYVQLTSPTITLPATNEDFLLSFDHYFALEEGNDGGLVYLIRNGGTPQYIAAEHFTFNAYTTELDRVFSEVSNPRGGRLSFSGIDGASPSGSWGTSRVNLTAAGALPGDQIQIVFELSHDGCGGILGWYVDDLAIEYCSEIVLPVVYDYWRLRPTDRSLVLEWATVEEIDNAGFAVERRAEGERTFRELAWIDGNGQRASTYRFTDTDVIPGREYFYRLRQRDYDGSEKLSSIRSGRISGAITGLTLAPNPVVNGTFRVYTGEEATDYLELFDLRGQRLREWSGVVNGQRLSVGDLPAGIYLLRRQNDVKRLFVE